MRILVHIKGGPSSIEGDVPAENIEELLKRLNNTEERFVILEKTISGRAILNKDNIGYITPKF